MVVNVFEWEVYIRMIKQKTPEHVLKALKSIMDSAPEKTYTISTVASLLIC